jgi:NADPH-dependent F420 reductase
MRVGIIGGTGEAGRGVACRLAIAGHEVLIGSRDGKRAADAAASVGNGVAGGENAVAAGFGEIVILAVPWEAATDSVNEAKDALAGRILISMGSALLFAGGWPQPLLPASGSLALGIQAHLPTTRVVAALHHVPAKTLLVASAPLDFDVLTCGADRAAVKQVMDLVASVPGLRPIDAGPLEYSVVLETLTPLLLGLNRRYRTRTGLRIQGVVTAPAASPGPARG